MLDENPDKSKKPKTRLAGQIIKRGEKKYLIRIFLGRDDMTGNRPRTLEIYTDNIARHIKPKLGNRKLSSV